MQEGKGIHCPYVPGTFRPLANKDNDYLIDRRAQKEKRAYSGVFGIAMQDASLQESMGPIQDHAKEKLLPTDRAIVMARRMLYEAATAMQDGAEPPSRTAIASILFGGRHESMIACAPVLSTFRPWWMGWRSSTRTRGRPSGGT